MSEAQAPAWPVEAARAAAAERGETQFVAVDLAVGAVDPLRHAFLPLEDRFYLERPNEGLRLLGLGCRAALENTGAARFIRADAQRAGLAARVHGIAADSPLLVGGFAFSPDFSPNETWRGFPSSRLTLPEMLWVEVDGVRTARTFVPVQPGEDAPAILLRIASSTDHWETLLNDVPTRRANRSEPAQYEITPNRTGSDYCHTAARALRSIHDGDLEKLVLARAVSLRAQAGFDAERALENLRDAHPGCALFALGRGDATFIGATPERLLRVRADRAETSAVAGSAPRGRDPQEDETLARTLQESKKEQSEHAVVVRALRSAFDACCDDVSAPEAPRLLRLDGVQHLETPLRGTLHPGTTLLGLAGKLHPTPAVGGAPYEQALAWLDTYESCERGWYAGLIGYVDAAGGGELCVALRSALVRGETAELLAGAGIVAGSEPEAELRETRLKLRTLLHALVEP